MATKLTLVALVRVDAMRLLPAFALRQIVSGDSERMPIDLEFRIESNEWPKDQVQVGCVSADDAIEFVRQMAGEELKKRGESLVVPPSDPAVVTDVDSRPQADHARIQSTFQGSPMTETALRTPRGRHG